MQYGHKYLQITTVRDAATCTRKNAASYQRRSLINCHDRYAEPTSMEKIPTWLDASISTSV